MANSAVALTLKWLTKGEARILRVGRSGGGGGRCEMFGVFFDDQPVTPKQCRAGR